MQKARPLTGLTGLSLSTLLTVAFLPGSLVGPISAWFELQQDAPFEAPSASPADVKSDCKLNGKQLWGRVQVVTAFPDLKVQVVDAFPDLRVQKVDVFADSCGKWQFVDVFPDLKIQLVDAFPDLKIKYVDAFPGNN